MYISIEIREGSAKKHYVPLSESYSVFYICKNVPAFIKILKFYIVQLIREIHHNTCFTDVQY